MSILFLASSQAMSVVRHRAPSPVSHRVHTFQLATTSGLCLIENPNINPNTREDIGSISSTDCNGYVIERTWAFKRLQNLHQFDTQYLLITDPNQEP